jgi:hypothetical protein
MPPAPAQVQAATEEPHTAPHDALVGVVRDLLVTSPGGVSLDALANALRERGFSRPPGSPRLITRLRRIKQLDVGRSGTIRLVENGEPTPVAPVQERYIEPPPAEMLAEAPDVDEGDEEPATGDDGAVAVAEPGTPAEGAPRRRRRRGCRRRRGRRNGAAAPVTAAPETA